MSPTRRDFIKTTAATAASLAAYGPLALEAFPQAPAADAAWAVFFLIGLAGTLPIMASPKPKMIFLFNNRDDLADYPLVKMHDRVIKSRDGLNLVCYLSLPPGSCSMLMTLALEALACAISPDRSTTVLLDTCPDRMIASSLALTWMSSPGNSAFNWRCRFGTP